MMLVIMLLLMMMVVVEGWEGEDAAAYKAAYLRNIISEGYTPQKRKSSDLNVAGLVPTDDCVIDPSQEDWIGDGFCDGVTAPDLNTAECGWDGGDCCPTTCVPALYQCPDQLFNTHCQSSHPTGQPSGMPTQLTEIVQVHDNIADHTSLASWCGAAAVLLGRKCNLRTAIRYCIESSTIPFCEIHLPENGTVEIDGGLFDSSEYFDSTEYITIRGYGSTVTRVGSSPARFLSLNINISNSFDLVIENIKFENFGTVEGDDEDGGLLRLIGLNSVLLENVTIQNVSAVGKGGVIYATNLKQSFTIRDSSIIGNRASASGGVLYFDDFDTGSLSVSGCNMTDNEAEGDGGVLFLASGVSGSIAETVMENNVAWGSGGAVYMNSTNDYFSLLKSIVRGNTATSYGGALYAGSNNGYITLESTSFVNNSASDGGALFMYEHNYNTSVYQCEFWNNDAGGNGGAVVLFWNNTDARFILSTFASNSAGGDGGGLHLEEGNHQFYLERCSLFNNIADSGGGMSIVNENNYLFVNNSGYIENIAASDGGGIFFGQSNQRSSFLNVNFNNNSATYGGGMIVNENNNNFLLDSCNLRFNSAMKGGGIYFNKDNDDIYMTNCALLGNMGSNYGGGIFANERNSITQVATTLKRNWGGYGGGIFLNAFNHNFSQNLCLMEENDALYGGAIASFIQNHNIHISQSEFLNNTASFAGGGIHFTSDNKFINVSHSDFSSNKAAEGGGIYLLDENLYFSFDRNKMIRNVASIFGGGICFSTLNNHTYISLSNFSSNTAHSSGGAVYYESRNGARIRECNFFNNKCIEAGGGAIAVNTLNSIIVESTYFDSNSAQQGGALSLTMRNSLKLSNCRVENGLAEFGGGIFLGFRDTARIFNVSFYANSAQQDGGGAYTDKFSSLLLLNTTWEQNTAHSAGAGLYCYSTGPMITWSQFLSNTASTGGGLCILGKEATVANNIFKYNQASGSTGNGGGLWANGHDLVIERNSFMHNNAGGNGAAISISDSSNVKVADNLAFLNNAEHGGAFSLENVFDALLVSNTVANNTASSSGGGLRCSTCGIVVDSDKYENNTVTGRVGGSAMWLNATDLNVEGNVVINQNRAPWGGGAIYWVHKSGMQEPSGLNNVTFSSNVALYGGNLATESIHLQVNTPAHQGEGYEGSEVDSQIVDVYQRPFVLSVVARDAYSQSVLSNSVDYIRAMVSPTDSYSCGGYIPTISGVVMTQLSAGTAYFEEMFVSCMPGGNMTIIFENAAALNVKSNPIPLLFRTCGIGEYYRDGECRYCEVGFFSMRDNADLTITKCEKCPSAAESCNKSTIVALPGYWAVSEESSKLLECPMGSSACPGGIQRKGTSSTSPAAAIIALKDYNTLDITDNENMLSSSAVDGCNEGYEGQLCAVCAEDYFYHPSSNTCKICEGDGHSTAIALLVLLSIFPGLFLCKLVLDKHRGKSEFSQMWDEEGFVTTVIFNCTLFWKNQRKREGNNAASSLSFAKAFVLMIGTKIRVLFSLLQIIACLPLALNLTFPPSFQGLTHLLGILAFDTFGIKCAGDFDYVDYVYGVTIFPLFVLGFFYICYMRYEIINYFDKESKDVDMHTKVQFKIKVVEFANMFIFLALTPVSCAIFRMFPCQTLDPENAGPGDSSYLSADFSISCESNRYAVGVSWAVIMLFVYPVGMPCFYAWQLYRLKDVIASRQDKCFVFSEDGDVLLHDDGVSVVDKEIAKQRDDSLGMFKFLYWPYKPAYWYWDIVEMLRKTFLCGWIIVFGYGTTLQVIIGCMFCLLFIKVYAVHSPFASRDAATTAELSMWQIFAFYFISLLLRDESFSDSRSTDIDVSLIAVIVIGFLTECFVWKFGHGDDVQVDRSETKSNIKYLDSVRQFHKNDPSEFSPHDSKNCSSSHINIESKLPDDVTPKPSHDNIYNSRSSSKVVPIGDDESLACDFVDESPLNNIPDVDCGKEDIIDNIDDDDDDDDDDENVLMC